MSVFDRFRGRKINEDALYDKLYRQKLREFGVRSPDDLSTNVKEEFWKQIKEEWSQYKGN